MSSLSERIMKKGKAGGMAEDIMELPGGGIGVLFGTLKKHIMSQTDIEEQKTWLKAAARANSLESFEQTNRTGADLKAGSIQVVQHHFRQSEAGI